MGGSAHGGQDFSGFLSIAVENNTSVSEEKCSVHSLDIREN
jgi:hypothetical protein